MGRHALPVPSNCCAAASSLAGTSQRSGLFRARRDDEPHTSKIAYLAQRLIQMLLAYAGRNNHPGNPAGHGLVEVLRVYFEGDYRSPVSVVL